MNEDKKKWQCTMVAQFYSYEDAVMASATGSERRRIMDKTASYTFQRYLINNPDIKAAGAVTVAKMYVACHLLGDRLSPHDFSLIIESSCALGPA